MADAEALKKTRSLIKSRFTRLVNGTSNNLETLTKTLLESRLTELKSIWLSVQERHDEYVMAVTNGEEQDAGNEHDTWITACQNTF